jgi:hypothetical protein
MKISLVLTTINKVSKNILRISKEAKKNNWNFIVVGDKSTPKNFKIKFCDFYNINDQKKLNFKFSKICPQNTYARKNIGYLIAIKKGSDVIYETDDDNYPKVGFFDKLNLFHTVKELKGSNWVNIYLNFIKKKINIWPRGLPLEYIYNKTIFKYKKIHSKFYLQQGICDGDPDVDAVYRLTNQKINIRFRNKIKFSLGKCLSPSNSQNTIWFKKIYPLMYLPVTCTMRATDIWRGLIALMILRKDRKKILFFGTSMYQNRNQHNLIKDFEQEVCLYINNTKMIDLIKKIKLKSGENNYFYNLRKIYGVLINKKYFLRTEKFFLNAWIKDCKTLTSYKKIT